MSPAAARRALIAAIAALGVGASLAGCAAVSSSEAHTAAPTHAREGDWFVETGCTACHSVSVYGLHSFTSTGPDLSVAVEDVPKRFGRSLEDFLRAPTGTMAMVLSGRIPLTEQQRAVAVEKLEDAYRRHQELAGAGRPRASH
jgi:hypothetical protein